MENYVKKIFLNEPHLVDLSKPFKKISMTEAIKEKTGIDFKSINDLDKCLAKILLPPIFLKSAYLGERILILFFFLSNKLSWRLFSMNFFFSSMIFSFSSFAFFLSSSFDFCILVN